MRSSSTLVWLAAAYALATWFPEPAVWVREFQWGAWRIPAPQLLLAGLLFCAGGGSSLGVLDEVRRVQGRFLQLAFVAWGLPVLSAALVIPVLGLFFGCPPGVALGIWIVAAMPIANSSVGWCSVLRGNVGVSIALLATATALSPILAPVTIALGATTIGTPEDALRATPWSEGMSTFFLLWVVMPIALGMLTASYLGPKRQRQLVPVVRRIGFAILIALNYLNGAACLPRLVDEPELLGWPIVGAVALVSVVYLACYLAGSWIVPDAETRENPGAERTSLLLAVVMRNTGAALVYAGAALPDFASIGITIIAYTMLQHVWVARFLAGKVNAASDSQEVPAVKLPEAAS